MDHRRSSFQIGYRTRKNVLKGKNIRKLGDGADNFLDYWTDSGSENTSRSDSDLSQNEEASNISEARLKTLRPGLRNSKSFHSETKIKDKQNHTKLSRSSSKPIKSKSYDKNIHDTVTEKQKLFSKHQQVHPNSAEILNSVSNSFGKSLNENVSKANINEPDIHMQSSKKVISTEANSTNAAIPESQPLANNKTSCKISSHIGEREEILNITGNPTMKKRKTMQLSKSVVKYDEYDAQMIEMAHDFANADEIPEYSENADGIPEDFENADEIPEDFENADEIPEHSENANETLEIVNQSKSLYNSKNKNINKIQENVKASEMLSKDNVENILDTAAKENEIKQTLYIQRKKSLNKTHENLKASETFSTENAESADISANGNKQNLHNIKKKTVTKTHENLKSSETFLSKNNESANIPAKRNKKECDYIMKKSVNKTHENLQASETFLTENADIPANRNKQNPDNIRKKTINKTHENLEALETFLTNTESAADTPEKENEITQNLNSKRKKLSNKTRENLKPSETFSTENAKSAADTPSKENEITLNRNSKRKIFTNKTRKNLEASEIFSKNFENIAGIPEVKNKITSYLHDKKNTCSNEKREKQKASETFSKDNQSVNEFLEVENGTDSIHNKRKKRVTENYESLSSKDNNNEQPVSYSKKKLEKNKICSTDSNGPLRRSSRQKFAPLAHWRNERLLYRTEKGIINIIGIDKGTGEDVVVPHARKLNEKPIKNVKNPPKIKLHDIKKKKKVCITLIKKFDVQPWDTKFRSGACQYRIKKIFETENSASGFIEIEVDAEKPIQYMPNEDIYLTLMKGKVEVTIENKVNLLEKNDMFVVPRCIPYKLKNVGSVKALLNFCVGKFNYLESES